jgi:hypothetical protein
MQAASCAMNIFTTEHPLVTPSSYFDSKKPPRLSYFHQVLMVALLFFAVFGGILLWALLTPVNEDVPDPSWTDSLDDVIGFVMGFPVFYIAQGVFATQGDAPPGMTRIIGVFIGVAVDSFFWAFVSVSFYWSFRWWIQMPPKPVPDSKKN